MQKTMWIVAVTMALVFGLAMAAGAADEAAAKPKIPGVGDKVPEFSLPNLGGGDVSFEKDIKGKHEATAIIFMTSACSACQAEVSAMNDIKGKFKEKLGIYAVAVDIRGADTVKPYTETYKYDATFLLDPKFTAPRLFGFSYTPSIVLADKAGKIVFKKGGYTPGDEDMIVEKVAEIVKK